MSAKSPGGMSASTLAMIIVVTTFGFANVIDNLVEMGLSAIPSWFLVGILYFLPLALILAEFASDTKESGGIYSYMERGLGAKWAFVGTWSYFVSNLFYLQTSFSRLPIRFSLSITGTDIFADSTAMLPILGVVICLIITWAASRGVNRFSMFATWCGWGTLALGAALVVVPLVLLLGGWRESATPFTSSALMPAFDLAYFATFSWLLFAVSGAEVAAPYVNQTRDPARDFPRAILSATLLIAAVYVLATIAVAILVPLETLTLATGLYDIWSWLAAALGLPREITARLCMIFLSFGSVVAYIVWAESPIRVMFSDAPKDTFPASLTQRDAAGTHHRALWMQAMLVTILTLVPLLSLAGGLRGSERFIGLLNDLASLSLVIPYTFVALAYIKARQQGMDAPFKMVRSNTLAVAIAWIVLVVSAAGYFGAGLFALQSDTIDFVYVGIIYGGPALLIGLGLLLRNLSIRTLAKTATI